MPGESSGPDAGSSSGAGRSLRLVTASDTLDRIHAFLDEALAGEPVDDLVRMQFEIAVAEIAANIVEHTARDAPVGVHLELRLLPDRLEAEFRDDGRPVQVDLASVALPDDLAERGRGLAIARGALDELSYQRDGDTNRWLLVRHR